LDLEISIGRNANVARTTGTASLLDMISAGTLNVDETLVIRRRSAASITGALEADGGIRVGGTSFTSPSAAARQALDVRAVDGWLRWRVPRLNDRTLADLRDSGVGRGT